MIKDFIEKCNSLGINLSESQLESFENLYNFLISENEKYNLTTITEKEQVYFLHFLDSLVGINYIPKNSNVLDVGSGGGFPALPLKIARDDINLTMVDSVTKKVNYLNSAISLLKLYNAIALHTRIEDLAKTEIRGSYDVVTARAVARLNTLCEYCLPLVKLNGIFIAYKSFSDEEVKEADNAIKILGGELLETVTIDILPEHRRTLIIIKKVSETPKKYPRGKNKERTNPII